MSETWKTDAALKESIEKEFGLSIGEPTKTHLAITGEFYVTLCSGGVKPEGEMVPAWYPTPDMAREAYRRAFIEYGISVEEGVRLNKLYWRTAPDMYERTVHEVGYHGELEQFVLYNVWSRLLISSKEAQEQAA